MKLEPPPCSFRSRRRSRFTGGLLAAGILAAGPGLADGTLDPSFGTGGVARVELPQTSGGIIRAAVRDPFGRILVGGELGRYPKDMRWFVARLLPGGELDPSFGSGGLVTRHVANKRDHAVRSIVPLGDGRILLAGDFPELVRLLPDGQPDPSFGIGGTGAVPTAPAIALAVDAAASGIAAGRLVCAHYERYAMRGSVARYGPDGQPDVSFGVGGQVPVDQRLMAFHLRPDGRMVVVGNAPLLGHAVTQILQLLPDGRPDPAFGVNGSAALTDLYA